MTPTNRLTRLRGMLAKAANGMDEPNRALIGAGGEFLTENLFDHVGWAWIKTVQHQNVYSAVLRDTVKASRPDYLVRIDGENFFCDAKHLSRSTNTGSQIGFAIEVRERDRLLAAEAYFNVPTLLVVWDRTDTRFTFTLAKPSSFASPISVTGRSCCEALFNPGDLLEHDI